MFLDGFLEMSHEHSRERKARPLFSAHCMVEVTIQTAVDLGCKGALNGTLAQSANNNPTGSAGPFSTVNFVQPFFNGSGTHTHIVHMCTGRLTTAFLEFPTVLFSRHPASVLPARRCIIVSWADVVNGPHVPVGCLETVDGRPFWTYRCGVRMEAWRND